MRVQRAHAWALPHPGLSVRLSGHPRGSQGSRSLCPWERAAPASGGGTRAGRLLFLVVGSREFPGEGAVAGSPRGRLLPA